ncbi:MAG TPA: OmpW family outer membrane protein [Burkholderiaceae bacterium]|nr:OmpW family outer membrane protein [Burkholderiaceae bacterium]
MKNTIAVALAALGLLSAAGAAHADENPWMVRARAVYLDFHNGQADGLPLGGTTRVDAKSRWIPEVDISYFFTPNIAAELVLTTPQSIDIDVGGAKEGKIRALPPSLLVQYHFTQFGAFKPYLGAGVNYTLFSKRSNILNGAASVDRSSIGFVAQAGFDYMIDKHWGVNVDVKYVQMNTDVHVGGVEVGKVDLNPITAGVGVTYRF